MRLFTLVGPIALTLFSFSFISHSNAAPAHLVRQAHINILSDEILGYLHEAREDLATGHPRTNTILSLARTYKKVHRYAHLVHLSRHGDPGIESQAREDLEASHFDLEAIRANLAERFDFEDFIEQVLMSEKVEPDYLARAELTPGLSAFLYNSFIHFASRIGASLGVKAIRMGQLYARTREAPILFEARLRECPATYEIAEHILLTDDESFFLHHNTLRGVAEQADDDRVLERISTRLQHMPNPDAHFLERQRLAFHAGDQHILQLADNATDDVSTPEAILLLTVQSFSNLKGRYARERQLLTRILHHRNCSLRVKDCVDLHLRKSYMRNPHLLQLVIPLYFDGIDSIGPIDQVIPEDDILPEEEHPEGT